MSKVKVILEFDTADESVKLLDIVRRATDGSVVDSAAPFGRDPFGTPFVSEADRERMQNLLRYATDEAGNYTGKIDPDTLSLYDWAFYVKAGLWKSGAKDYAIFTKKPIVRDRDNGRVLQNPEAELAAVDVTGYTGPLAPFA